MNIAALECFLYDEGVPFVHLTPDQTSATKAKSAFFEEYGFPVEDPEARFSACTIAGTAVNHVPVLILENAELMDPRALNEARAIPAPDRAGTPAMIIKVTR